MYTLRVELKSSYLHKKHIMSFDSFTLLVFFEHIDFCFHCSLLDCVMCKDPAGRSGALTHQGKGSGNNS